MFQRSTLNSLFLGLAVTASSAANVSNAKEPRGTLDSETGIAHLFQRRNINVQELWPREVSSVKKSNTHALTNEELSKNQKIIAGLDEHTHPTESQFDEARKAISRLSESSNGKPVLLQALTTLMDSTKYMHRHFATVRLSAVPCVTIDEIFTLENKNLFSAEVNSRLHYAAVLKITDTAQRHFASTDAIENFDRLLGFQGSSYGCSVHEHINDQLCDISESCSSGSPAQILEDLQRFKTTTTALEKLHLWTQLLVGEPFELSLEQTQQIYLDNRIHPEEALEKTFSSNAGDTLLHAIAAEFDWSFVNPDSNFEEKIQLCEAAMRAFCVNALCGKAGNLIADEVLLRKMFSCFNHPQPTGLSAYLTDSTISKSSIRKRLIEATQSPSVDLSEVEKILTDFVAYEKAYRVSLLFDTLVNAAQDEPIVATIGKRYSAGSIDQSVDESICLENAVYQVLLAAFQTGSFKQQQEMILHLPSDVDNKSFKNALQANLLNKSLTAVSEKEKEFFRSLVLEMDRGSLKIATTDKRTSHEFASESVSAKLNFLDTMLARFDYPAVKPTVPYASLDSLYRTTVRLASFHRKLYGDESKANHANDLLASYTHAVAFGRVFFPGTRDHPDHIVFKHVVDWLDQKEVPAKISFLAHSINHCKRLNIAPGVYFAVLKNDLDAFRAR